jgi:hypothetical protein
LTSEIAQFTAQDPIFERHSLEMPGELAPGEAVDGLIVIVDALLTVLMSTGQATDVLQALGLAAITATTSRP